MAIPGGRPNNRQAVPYLMVRDARAALQFYQKAFGAETVYLAPLPGTTASSRNSRSANRFSN